MEKERKARQGYEKRGMLRVREGEGRESASSGCEGERQAGGECGAGQ